MATAALASAGNNRLRYLITAAGTTLETVSITSTGAATPDVLTDSPNAGPINALAKVISAGYGSFASGAQTQAKARALWLSDLSGANPSIAGNVDLPLSMGKITPRTGGGVWSLDANVSGGNPIISVSVTGGGTAYLDLEVPGTIGA